MSKLKAGSTVRIREREYKVTTAAGAYAKRCMVCQMHNKCIPCFDSDPHSKNEWPQSKCIASLPVNCYLKPV